MCWNSKTNFKIVKTIFSRCLYALYIAFAVWRVVVARDDSNFWYLMIALLPLLIETLYMACKRRGEEFKWMSPGVMFYLMGAIPCIWFWEIRTFELNIPKDNENTTCDNLTGICLTHEAWTLALEQTILFILILGKWVAPKGKMSRDELSQLLLVYLGAGGDIMEMLDLTRDDDIKKKRDVTAVYVILAVWSWSLLQFAFVTTAVKDMPTILSAIEDLKEEKEEEWKESEMNDTELPEKQTEIPGTSQGKVEIEKWKAQNEKEIADYPSSDRPSVCCIPCCYDNKMFIFHNEIWGMVAGLLFQDVPFLAVRIVVMVIFNVVSHTTIFFAIKNAFVIILLANRIRVIMGNQKYKWWRVMREARHQRQQRISGVVTADVFVGDKRRETFTYETKKPKWLIWRS